MELSQKRTPRKEPVIEVLSGISLPNITVGNKSHMTLIDSRTNPAIPRAHSENKWRQALLNLR